MDGCFGKQAQQTKIAMTTEQRYEKKNKKSKQNVCFALIKHARDTRQMRTIAAYYLLKRQFSHSTIFNYRSRLDQVAGLCQVSSRTLHTYVKTWRALGIAKDHGANLVLISTRDVKRAYGERFKAQITRMDGEGLGEVEARLYAKILEQDNRKVNHNYKLMNFEKGRRAEQRDTLIRPCGESLPGAPAFSLSLRTAASNLNVSVPKATKIMRLLNRLEVISTIPNPPKPVGQGVKAYRAMRDDLGYFFIQDNTVYRQFGSKHRFIEYPPSIKPMTYGQFMYNLRNAKEETKKKLYSAMNVKT